MVPGRQLEACSLAVFQRHPYLPTAGDCSGEVIALGDAALGLVVGDIDLTALRAWGERFPALRDRRPNVYPGL
jgi:hypothetical protein